MDEKRFKFDRATVGALLAGRLSLGATFWVGLIVADLTVAMLYVWFSAAVAVAGPGGMVSVLGKAGLVLAAFYMAAMLPATLRAARANPAAGGYRWVAVGFALAHVAAYLVLVAYAFSA
ncbi:hypothetical protein [Phaeovulum sp.]|uniref:hypothetical protein n=1 Tax=Phaeovulum sp. TaxID=2934796 RepID=UPI0039E35365